VHCLWWRRSVGKRPRAARLVGAASILAVVGAFATSSLPAVASGSREIRVSASFVYLTAFRNHSCEAYFGIEYKGVAGASYYSFRYVQHPYGVQDLKQVVPQASEDVLLDISKPPAPKGDHFDLLTGGGGAPSATGPRCVFAKNPYAKLYSGVTGFAVVP
jgi:hypothetical protein